MMENKKILFHDELKNFSRKEILTNVPITSLKIIAPDKKVFRDRKIKLQERPTRLMQTERWYSKRVLDIFDAGKIELTNVTKIDFPEKTLQLGEKAQIYGKVLSRAESFIHNGEYTLNDESLIVSTAWRKFTDGLSTAEKRQVIKYRDYFLRVLFYSEKPNGSLVVEEKPFLMINFSCRTSDGRLQNLKNLDDVKNIQSIENIELRLNRGVFGCLHKYLDQRDEGKKNKIGGGGVRKSVRALPDMISSRIEFYKPFVIKQAQNDPNFRSSIFDGEHPDRIRKVVNSLRYNDRMRIAFDMLLDILFTGMQNRKKKRIDFGTCIYDLLFVSKHSGDNIRFAYIISVFNIILNDMEGIQPLFLTIDKNFKGGKDFKNLHADLELPRLPFITVAEKHE